MNPVTSFLVFALALGGVAAGRLLAAECETGRRGGAKLITRES